MRGGCEGAKERGLNFYACPIESHHGGYHTHLHVTWSDRRCNVRICYKKFPERGYDEIYVEKHGNHKIVQITPNTAAKFVYRYYRKDITELFKNLDNKDLARPSKDAIAITVSPVEYIITEVPAPSTMPQGTPLQPVLQRLMLR